LGPASLAAANSLLYNGRGIPAQVSALAILLPRRGYATEHNTSTSSLQSYPPPGFNAEQAKKPIPQEQAQTVKPVASSQSDVAKVPARDVPTKAAAVENAKNLAEEKKETKKLTIGQKIKKEVQHYWDGTKLLATEVKISSRLALKMAGGYELSRREHRQVCGFTPRSRGNC
jgi:LETM1 and EF-hand domain-containing protein 1